MVKSRLSLELTMKIGLLGELNLWIFFISLTRFSLIIRNKNVIIEFMKIEKQGHRSPKLEKINSVWVGCLTHEAMTLSNQKCLICYWLWLGHLRKTHKSDKLESNDLNLITIFWFFFFFFPIKVSRHTLHLYNIRCHIICL